MRRALTAAALLAAVLATAAGAATPGQIVARLNAQREANGIPGGLELNPEWTTGCMHHVRYEELNGIQWTHVETPGKPGFTKDGQLAGLGGDQAYEYDWLQGNPFENLPLHLATLLAPSLMQIGAYESGRRTCVEIVLGGGRQIPSDTIYAYPGPNRTGVPSSQVVRNEWPASPGDVVGLPQGRTTGPTIYIFAAGPWQYQQQAPTLKDAKLTGPKGPVPIRVVIPDEHAKIKIYVAPGVFFLIPVSPLAPGTRYTATVTVTGNGDSQTKTWSFRTG